jgi:hypothetical protein
MQKKFGIAAFTALLAAPVAAQAQGISGGMERVRGKVTPLAARRWGRGRCAWWRSRRRRQLSAFYDYVLLKGRSSYTYAEPVQPGIIF